MKLTSVDHSEQERLKLSAILTHSAFIKRKSVYITTPYFYFRIPQLLCHALQYTDHILLVRRYFTNVLTEEKRIKTVPLLIRGELKMSGEDGELKILRNGLEEVRLYLQV